MLLYTLNRINSPGALRVPCIPEEFKTFKGQIIHTATWDSTVELENKVVGVIGSGASAIQIVPALAEKVKELHSYQRKPSWILPKNQVNISKCVQWMFRNIPFVLVLYRWFLFLFHELFYLNFLYDSTSSKMSMLFLSSSKLSSVTNEIILDLSNLDWKKTLKEANS